MREKNFGLPHKNQAASTITHALYDRRALDCTSTLPLVNSLNSLVYLTTSSARIRQILCNDGGLERLVTMLKRTKWTTNHETMKWFYALQCVVNIGVRGSDTRSADSSGSEAIRTRVVEADVVPVIATLLENYLQGMDKLRAKCSGDIHSDHKKRRQPPPPPIDTSVNVPPPPVRSAVEHRTDQLIERLVPTFSSPPNQTTFPNQQTHHQHSQSHHHLHARSQHLTPHHHHHHRRRQSEHSGPILPSLRTQNFGLHHLEPPPMSAGLRAEDSIASHPGSPSTPTGPTQLPSSRPARPSARQAQPTQELRLDPMSGDSDDDQANSAPEDGGMNVMGDGTDELDLAMDLDAREEPSVQTEVVEATRGLLDTDVGEEEANPTFNILHRTITGEVVEPMAQQPDAFDPAGGPTPTPAVLPDNSMLFAPVPTPLPFSPMNDLAGQQLGGATDNSPPSHSSNIEPLTWMPRHEHIVLCLQLLAYVSKYCNLRPYFQSTHLVPGLKPEAHMRARAKAAAAAMRSPEEQMDVADELDPDDDAEYCQPETTNLFPLVEKFTIKSYSADMKYWACVVMRNLCRKDKSRGDIRQCAYWKCGKWETYVRQFAKCRRCRQTKYCSKECQKLAWVWHRHWCEPARGESGAVTGEARSRRGSERGENWPPGAQEVV